MLLVDSDSQGGLTVYMGYYNSGKFDKAIASLMLDIIDFNSEGLLKQILIDEIQANIIVLYLTQDILKKIMNSFASENIVRCLIKKLVEKDNKQ